MEFSVKLLHDLTDTCSKTTDFGENESVASCPQEGVLRIPDTPLSSDV